MLHVREFTSAAELLAHYAALRAKTFAPRKRIPAVAPSPRGTGAVEESASTATSIVIDPMAWARYVPRDKRGPLWRSAPNRAKRLVRRIAYRHGIPAHLIYSESRRADVVMARHLAIYRVWLATGWSYPQLGVFFGDRDHTAALHAVRKFRDGADEYMRRFRAKNAAAHAAHLSAQERARERDRARQAAKRARNKAKRAGDPKPALSPRTVDLTGLQFGRLTVVGPGGFRGTKRLWKCCCECGAEISARADRLKNGDARSCGCLQKEVRWGWGVSR